MTIGLFGIRRMHHENGKKMLYPLFFPHLHNAPDYKVDLFSYNYLHQ